MRLQEITATPHPAGNRIDLHWINPDPNNYPGVRVVRREGTHPVTPQDGIVVVEGRGLNFAVDAQLKGETVYYYTLFPFKGRPPVYHLDPHNRVSAMATAAYNFAGQMYDLLPAIYHRYDTAFPKADSDKVSEEDKQTGQLRRFLDLPGGQLDQLYSFARAMFDLYNLEKTDGRLLPLLAQWIGWQTDYRLEIDAQRNELRNAPHVYKTIGIIPTVEATVKRIFGWESRTKEFVHNVFLSNCPERLNLWLGEQNSRGQWSTPTEPFSLDFAYEGRPAAVLDGSGIFWLFYHTLKKGRWEIWYKTLVTFNLPLAFEPDLDEGIVSLDLQRVFATAGFLLSRDITIKKQGSGWRLADRENGQSYLIKKGDAQLTVYRWAPSQPLSSGTHLERHPTAAIQGDKLWIFWDSYDGVSQRWEIRYRTRTGGQWSSIDTFPDSGIDRRRPWAVADNLGGLWLFWLEQVGTEWRLKYNRHDGLTWSASPQDFPVEGDPKVESNLFVLFHPSDATQPLWVFWSRKAPTGEPNQTRWQIAYRVKQSLDPAAADWRVVRTLPKETPDVDDREPAALIAAAGNVELFWSSTRDGSWSIWRASVDGATHNWRSFEQITGTPYSQRDPLPISRGADALLLYRSNASLVYNSTVYGASETRDGRYAGCTTVDTRNLAKRGLRGQYEDFQVYTYDAGQNGKRTDRNWYARDTIGMYLTPTTDDPALIIRNRKLIESVLRQFLPIQVRVVFIIALADEELVYTYDFPTAKSSRVIAEQFFDSTIPETYLGLGDSSQDIVPDWVWIRAWSEAHPNHRTLDFTTIPIDTRFRTWHTRLEAGG
jgi:hypothetical protein